MFVMRVSDGAEMFGVSLCKHSYDQTLQQMNGVKDIVVATLALADNRWPSGFSEWY